MTEKTANQQVPLISNESVDNQITLRGNKLSNDLQFNIKKRFKV